MKALFALMLVSTAALADDAALLKCRQLEDGPVRLACYNAIPANPMAPATPVAAAATAARPAGAAAYTTVPQPTPAEMAAMFGVEPEMLKSVRLQTLETSIAGPFDGWVRGQRIRLANGQVWKVVDDTEDVVELMNPKVTVKRGLLGAIFLDIEGAHRNPKVQRVQ
ncbi:hypothetical protein SAMN05192549_12044 [Duganella sacchari]|uniref:Type IV pilus biogenesis protein PilP n=1 Tax=Duganella sacchari TaxID=551987 RepID=A0A1M7RD85_9BURK|nr:hypothetical protein [Duganella sacchari]SHN44131.1 hypothetical protein SAMN05192549_12044 [Duganella sacchari]